MSTENLLNEQRIKELEIKLRQSVYDLDYCRKEKDEFIYIASHDLKAPLRKVITFTERLVQKAADKLNEHELRLVERIQKNILAMQSLIDDLSVFSEIERAVHFQKCDLNNIIEEVLTESELKLKENESIIHLSDLPTLGGNASQLKKVFENLIENAILFQPEGQAAEIIISSHLLGEDEKIKFNLPAEKIYYEIRFADNGIGFNENDAEQILKPFVKLNGQSSYPGNGLGLAVCDKIIKLHHGIFYANGIENKGSVFVLILPGFFQ
jgi:signal transduction histidine kinase